MKYCLNLPIGGQAAHPRILAEFAAVAEESGWDAVFVEDYVVYQNRQDLPTYDPWVALAAMALSTSRIRLGTMVTPLARRRPWKVAREAVSLDHLSDGRLILGVGLGDPEDSTFTTFGEEVNLRVRARILDESLDILTGLWNGEPFSYQGTYFNVKEVTYLPRPVQQPRIPIWIGGAYPNLGPLRRAARWDGACLYKAIRPGSAEDSEEALSPEEIRDVRLLLERHRVGSGSVEIVAGGPPRGNDAGLERERVRELAAAGAAWFSEWIPPSEPAFMRSCIARGPLRIDGT